MGEEDEVFEKEVNQVEKVEPVAKALTDMGSFYKTITKKLSDDGVCFITGKKIGKKEIFDIVQVPHDKLQKGMVAFVSVSKDIDKEEEQK